MIMPAKSEKKRTTIDRDSTNRIVYLGITLFVFVLAILCFQRPTINYGIETDFLGGFMYEAIRFLNGEPLVLAYHPPLYSMAIATLYLIFKDWVTAGMILSLFSSGLVLTAAYHVLKSTFGTKEAIGGVLALVFSWGFIRYSIVANSDIFFFALFFFSLACIALAENRESKSLWLVGGITAGLTILTRSNGLPVLCFVLFAFTANPSRLSKKTVVVTFVSGMLLILTIWAIYAKCTDSPIYVKSNHENLALSYFTRGDDRASADALVTVKNQFSSIWQVLAYDPGHILFKYGVDLKRTMKRLFTQDIIIAFPLVLLSLPGIVLLVIKNHNRFQIILYLNLVAMCLFVNLHAYFYRFYLFMIPIMGAGIMVFLYHARTFFKAKPKPFLLIMILPILVLFFLTTAIPGYTRLVKGAATDSLAASKILLSIENPEKLLVISRKPHLKFYAGLKGAFFPNVQTVAELKSRIKALIASHPDIAETYLFYGRPEKRQRSQFSMLQNADVGFPWLKKVGAGNELEGWVLFRVLDKEL